MVDADDSSHVTPTALSTGCPTEQGTLPDHASTLEGTSSRGKGRVATAARVLFHRAAAPTDNVSSLL
jgi:hypothetical protein